MNYAFRMKLKPGTVAEYKRRHDEIWPELAQLLREAGIYDYSIFLDEEDMHLFAVLKLRDNNKRELLPSHPVMRRWWMYMQDLMYTQPDGRPNEWPLTPMFHLDYVRSVSRSVTAQSGSWIQSADIDRQIQLLIRNLVEIKDTSGEFLLRLPDGRVIDTKGWNDWEWTHGVGLYGIYKYYQHDARRALPRDHAQLVPRPLRRRHAHQEHQHRRAVPHARLSVRRKPRQLLAALSRRVGGVAHGRPAAHRGEWASSTSCSTPRTASSSGTTR